MFKYRRDIDGLRALSVLAVILFHAFPYTLKNGYLGVDVFFVISGYLISAKTFQELKEGEFSIVNFYLRRIKRILPVALIVLIVTTVIALLTLHYSEFIRFQKSLAAAAFFFLNYQLQGESGYFDISTQLKPLMHYWSLAVEEQFYLIWPLVILSLVSIKNKKILGGIFSIAFFFSLAGFFFTNYFADAWSEGSYYYSLQVRAWELLLGLGVAALNESELFKKQTSPLNENRLINFSSLGMAFLFAGLVVPFKVWINLFAALGAGFIILNNRNNFFTKFLSTKWMVGIGLASYSLYLWHWPFLSFLRIYNANPGIFVILLAVLIAAVLSFLTYYFVERPLKHQTWSVRLNQDEANRSVRYRAYALLLCTSVLFAGAMYLKPFFSGEPESYSEERPDFEVDQSCLLNEIHHNDKPARVAFCYTSKRDSPSRGLIVGDSHANAFFPGIDLVYTNIKWSIVAHHSCMPVVGNDAGTRECGESIDEAIRYAVKEKFKVIVFVTSNRVFEIQSKRFGTSLSKETYEKELSWMSGQEAHPAVVVLDPVPEYNIWPQQCMGNRVWFVQTFLPEAPPDCEKPKVEWLKESEKYKKFNAGLKEKFPWLITFDPTEVLCGQSKCSLPDFKYYYRDTDHLNLWGSTYVINAMKEQLNKKDAVF